MSSAVIKKQARIIIREQMEKYMAQQPCPTCKGHRLKNESLAVKVDALHIGEVTAFSIEEADAFLCPSLELIGKRNEDCQSDFSGDS